MKRGVSIVFKTLILLLAFVASLAMAWNLIAFFLTNGAALSERALMFLLGALIFFALYQFVPLPKRVYVFGHELTHALAIKLFGGTVRGFHIGKDGGAVKTDTSNAFIALAPYFIPLYTVFFIVVYSVVDIVIPLSSYGNAYYALIGFAYAFHIATTFLFARSYQPDLQEEGLVFSYCVITFANILVFVFLLNSLVDDFSLLGFFGASLDSIINAVTQIFKTHS